MIRRCARFNPKTLCKSSVECQAKSGRPSLLGERKKRNCLPLTTATCRGSVAIPLLLDDEFNRPLRVLCGESSISLRWPRSTARQFALRFFFDFRCVWLRGADVITRHPVGDPGVARTVFSRFHKSLGGRGGRRCTK